MTTKYLNLGCGYRFHPDWTNVDGHVTGHNVLVHDLRRPLPFDSETFEVVYHSHTLEHFDPAAARRFIGECFRLLKPGGILRVVVPDLEGIARLYLEILDRAAAEPGDITAQANHKWMVIEMVDQLARNDPGGELERYVSDPDLANRDFVIGRWGAEGMGHIMNAVQTREEGKSTELLARLVKAARLRLGQIGRYPFFAREVLLKLLLGKSYGTWALGRYRESGDVHLWMYDRVTLPVLLRSAGFERVVRCTANDSAVADWGTMELDTNADQAPYRPNSLYMEAFKP